jgi:hypothetical protein
MKRLTTEIYGAVELQYHSKDLERLAKMAQTDIVNKYEAYYQLKTSELDFDWYERLYFFGVKVNPVNGFRRLRFGVPDLEYMEGENFHFYTYSKQLEVTLKDAGYDLEKPIPLEFILIYRRKAKNGRNWEIIAFEDVRDRHKS